MQHISYKEDKPRGTLDFPADLYHVRATHPQYVMNYHWHVEYELIRILEGQFILSLEESEITVPADSVILVPAGHLHAGIPVDCVYECMVFDINMLIPEDDQSRSYFGKIINQQLKLQHIFSPEYKDIHQIVWSLFDAFACRKPGYQLLVRGGLYQFFGTLISDGCYQDQPLTVSKSHRRMVQLKHVLEYIQTNYSRHISLEEMAENAGMSPKYFCRFFQEMTHRTPVDYLNYYRIERACYELVTTDCPITDIAYNSGFNDLSYFIKTFKKYKHTTPKKYLN